MNYLSDFVVSNGLREKVCGGWEMTLWPGYASTKIADKKLSIIENEVKDF